MGKAILIFALGLSTFSWGHFYSLEAYYKPATGLSGYQLKTAVKSIITNNHRDRGYDELIPIYFESDADLDFDRDGSILDMYSEDPRGRDSYTYSSPEQACGNYNEESDCFNREHLFPQSIFHKRRPMRNDFFQVFPTDGYVNNRRGSLPFGEVADPEWISQNGCKVGPNTFGNYRGKVFEPIDEFKGDIARALLYFATRYEDQIADWQHEMLNGTSSQVYEDWFLELLIKWHESDPVSAHEKRRNEVGFRFQGNRNPFVDHPEWVQQIWGVRQQPRKKELKEAS